jgi:hypothetical protein
VLAAKLELDGDLALRDRRPFRFGFQHAQDLGGGRGQHLVLPRRRQRGDRLRGTVEGLDAGEVERRRV